MAEDPTKTGTQGQGDLGNQNPPQNLTDEERSKGGKATREKETPQESGSEEDLDKGEMGSTSY